MSNRSILADSPELKITARDYITAMSKVKLVANGKQSDAFYIISDLVDAMPHAERIKLRQELEALGCKQILRNFYYDYSKQMWIE